MYMEIDVTVNFVQIKDNWTSTSPHLCKNCIVGLVHCKYLFCLLSQCNSPKLSACLNLVCFYVFCCEMCCEK